MNPNPAGTPSSTSRRPRRLAWPLLALALSAGAWAGMAGSAYAANAPGASTSQASGVTYSSAVLNGSVDPHGQQTNYVFQYGTSASFGSQTPLAPAGAGTGSVKVSQTITGLAPLTTYHYRILASSPAGATVGAEHTFTTPPIPLTLLIAGVPDPVVFGSSFVVEGTLSGTGAAGHEVELQANPFPYLGGFLPVGNPELASSTGGFSFPSLGLSENTQLRVVTVGKPEVASPPVLENVAVRVSLHVRATRRRGYARLYGTVTPSEVGALVGFQLLRPGRSLNKGGTVLKADTAATSSFSRVVRVQRGVYKALVQVVADGAHVSGYSPPVLIR
jgi:hypothetical protein